MPYAINADLPSRVRDNLPEHAQSIYREAFNHAYQEYQNPAKRREAESREEVAHKVAWSAVKGEYQKTESGQWKRTPEH